jgi:hypothetical protein
VGAAAAAAAAAGAVYPLRHVLIPVDGTPQAECVTINSSNLKSLIGMNPAPSYRSWL